MQILIWLGLMSSVLKQGGVRSAGHFTGLLNGTHADTPRSATRFTDESGRLIVGCRPRAVRVVKNGETSPPATFQVTGRVYVAAPLREVTLVTI